VDLKKLVAAINSEAGAGVTLSATRMDRSFEVCWAGDVRTIV
jgi:hypothetical protein